MFYDRDFLRKDPLDFDGEWVDRLSLREWLFNLFIGLELNIGNLSPLIFEIIIQWWFRNSHQFHQFNSIQDSAKKGITEKWDPGP